MQSTTQCYKVNIIESESGWGQKVDDVKFFDSLEEARKFVEDFNSKNDSDTVPYIYWYAEDPVRCRRIE